MYECMYVCMYVCMHVCLNQSIIERVNDNGMAHFVALFQTKERRMNVQFCAFLQL